MQTSSNKTFVYFVFSIFLFSLLSAYPVSEKWNVQTTQTSSGPALSGNYLFAVSDEGVVTALDRLTGTQAWTYDMGKKVSFSPLFYNNILYVGAEDGLYAFNLQGTPVGNISFNSSIY